MAKYNRISYDEYVKPLEHIQKAHDASLNDMANISAQSDMLDFYLDPDNDPESYARYQDFKKNFNTFVDDFARNGYTRGTGTKGLQLHREYNDKITNILDSLKNKKTEEAAQMSAQEKSNGQMVFSKYAHNTSVDDYAHGKMGYQEQNLDEVHKFAKNAAAAASKRKYSNDIADAIKVLGNNYYNIMEQEGYNTRDSYGVISDLLTDMENQLNGGVSPTEGGDDTPDGFIRNMRAELQKRGIENYSEEDRRKIIDAFLTGTYEGLGYEQKNKQLETPEMKARGAAKNYTNINLGNHVEKDDTHYITDDNFAASTFDNSNSNAQKEAYANMFNGTNEVYKAIIVPSKKYTDEFGNPLHRFATITEWMTNVGYVKDKFGNYTNEKTGGIFNRSDQQNIGTQNNPLWVPKQAVKGYKESLRNIESLYHFSPRSNGDFGDEISGAINPKSVEQCIEYIIPRQMEINENDAKAHQYLSTVLKIDPSNKDAALKEMLGLLGDTPILTGAQYVPKTHTWKFKSNSESADIKKLLSSGEMNKGVTISLVDMPTSINDKNPLWVQLNIPKPDGEGAYIGFVPLAKYAHSSESKTATQFNELVKRRKEIIKRNAEILGIPNNITIQGINNLIVEYKKIKDKDRRNAMLDAAAQILDSIPLVDLYLHRKNMIASDGTSANRTIKQVIDDMNKAEGND